MSIVLYFLKLLSGKHTIFVDNCVGLEMKLACKNLRACQASKSFMKTKNKIFLGKLTNWLATGGFHLILLHRTTLGGKLYTYGIAINFMPC